MRLLDRYLLREMLLPLGFCLGGFLVFWVAFDLFAKLPDLQAAKLTSPDIAGLYLVRAPEILVVLIPVALLLALLYSLTQHSRHHEITAMRAAGISVWRLAAPYFAVGLLLSLTVFALNEFLVPDASDREDEIMTRRLRPAGAARDKDIVRNLGFNKPGTRRSWQIGAFNLRSGETLQPKISWYLQDGTLCWLIAERGIFTNGAWCFFSVNEWRQSGDTNAMLAPYLRTNLLILPELTETPGEIRSEVRMARRLTLRKAKQADIPLFDLLDYVRLHPRLQGKDYSWIHTKLHGRLATPWTCLVVVLLAIPFGAPSGRRNIFVGVASSIFICFAFFILQQFSMAMGCGGVLPPWLAAWLPNLFFGGAAVWMIGRMR